MGLVKLVVFKRANEGNASDVKIEYIEQDGPDNSKLFPFFFPLFLDVFLMHQLGC
jgi:hypothetical protein